MDTIIQYNCWYSTSLPLLLNGYYIAINNALYKRAHNSFVLEATKLKFYSVRSSVSNGVQHKAVGRSMDK